MIARYKTSIITYVAILGLEICQNQTEEFYIYFDSTSDDKCQVESGYGEPANFVAKYRKSQNSTGQFQFRLCDDEIFTTKENNEPAVSVEFDDFLKIKFKEVQKLRLDFKQRELDEIKNLKNGDLEAKGLYLFNDVKFYIIEKTELGELIQHEVDWQYIKAQH